MPYRFGRELVLPILSDGGDMMPGELIERARAFEESGFGEGVSGRIIYKGHHASHQGVASMTHITLFAEYDTTADLHRMVERIDGALNTPHSRVLRFT